MRMQRVIDIDCEQIVVPPYVTRSSCGWQTRVRGVPSLHFADGSYGGAKEALKHATAAVQAMLVERENDLEKGVL